MSGMKRLDVSTVGLNMSERLLVGAFLDLIALTDGHVFRLCDYSDAPIVVFNPDNSDAEALMTRPQPGVAYIQYGMAEICRGTGGWHLGAPVRLGALRETLIAIVEQRREWKLTGVLTPSSDAGQAMGTNGLPGSPSSAPGVPVSTLTVLPVPAHRKLEQVLAVLERITQSRIPHALTGIAGVEIVVFPQENAVYVQCNAGVSSWQKALVESTRPVAAFSHVGAKPAALVPPITIEQLRWELARHLSAGMLLPGLASMLEFGLTRWPDFGTMSVGSGYDLRVVALIATRPTSIAAVLKVVPYTREGIIALLNGCALIGCLRDAPADLLTQARQARLSATLSQLGAPETSKAPLLAARLDAPDIPPQRGFVGMLSKLRAALSFAPRVNS